MTTIPLDFVFKCILVGDSNTGKSSFLNRIYEDIYDENIRNTIGVDFKVKVFNVDNKNIKLTIWDTAGNERFRTLTGSYYRGAQFILLFFDFTNKSSFDNLHSWIKEIKDFAPKNTYVCLVGNKCDGMSLTNVTNDISENKIREFIKDNDISGYYKISCKDNTITNNNTVLSECTILNEIISNILSGDPEVFRNCKPAKSNFTASPPYITMNKSDSVDSINTNSIVEPLMASKKSTCCSKLNNNTNDNISEIKQMSCNQCQINNDIRNSLFCMVGLLTVLLVVVIVIVIFA